ncbi:MAG: cytochrome c [Dehalococcoidia bacterium]|nr:cytochrome c [Dehalococcoidia bacterium]
MSKIFGYTTSNFSYQKMTLAVVLAVVFAGIPAFGGMASVLAQSADDGEALFSTNGCVGCHSTGEEPGIGPGLAGIAERASTRTSLSADEYIRQSLADPGEYIVDGFALVAMPSFGDLTDTDVDSLIAYLGTLSDGDAAPVAAQVSAPDNAAPEPILADGPTGDPATGENLFTGSDRFERKGPPCSACHSSSGLGALGGGTLGPDLTGAFAKLGAGMMVFPETSPTMKPIFTDRKLTDQEKADLLAFFELADASDRDTQEVIELAGLALIGTAIIALFTHLIWRKRLRSVRKTMVGR